MNLARLLERAGRAWPDRPGLVHGERLLATNSVLAGRVAALAAGLGARLGLRPGDRVVLFARNHPTYLEAMFAAWWAGLAIVPVNVKLHARELAYVLGHVEARAVLYTDDVASTVAEAAAEAGTRPALVEMTGRDLEALRAGDHPPCHPSVPGDVAWIFYTSGTTGRPKGAMLTHANLLAMTQAYFCDVDTIAPADCLLHAAPMSHGSGIYIVPHVAAGAANIVPESGAFDEAEVLALCRAHRGVGMFAAPTIVKRLAQAARTDGAPVTGLKTIVYGGGPMYREDLHAATEVFGDRLAQIYGQGESPMTITALSKALHADRSHPRFEDRLASVGYPQLGVEVRVVDAEDRDVPAGETGEVVCRGAPVMRGYWRDEAASARALAGGWLHTGDLGRLDADGFLTLTDRSKDLIISGGSNIYPREVEEVLLRHPDVAEAAVVGRPDPEWGEAVVAFVRLRPGAARDADALDRLCLAEIARFKRPKDYRFVEDLPKNAYGKVLKTELRRRVTEER